MMKHTSDFIFIVKSSLKRFHLLTVVPLQIFMLRKQKQKKTYGICRNWFKNLKQKKKKT